MKKVTILACLSFLISCHGNLDSHLVHLSILPKFGILLADSVKMVNMENVKLGKSILLVYFRPDCPHSQKVTRDLIAKVNQFNDCQIYFVSGAKLKEIGDFAHAFKLDQYPNLIRIGKDQERSFFRAFGPNGVPFIAVYSEQKALVKIYHGEVPIERILVALHG